jgi:YegS/Rv2252/BmrU family lipid kinase
MYYYILNPAAGGGRINKIQDRLKARLKELGIAGEFVKSIGEGDITKLTKLGIERGFKTIVAVGGDGTINEVINGLSDTSVAMGIIPIGNSNELAKTLGITDWQSACNILAARKIEEVDLGKIGKKFFVTSVNIGFETDASRLKSDEQSFFKKIKDYKNIISWATKYKSQTATIYFDDNFSVETDFLNIQVSNGQFVNFLSNARPQDKMLDIIILAKMPHGKTFRYVVGNKNDELKKKLSLSIFKAKRVAIRTPKPIDVSVDGLAMGKTPIVCEVANRKLKVIVSKNRKF